MVAPVPLGAAAVTATVTCGRVAAGLRSKRRRERAVINAAPPPPKPVGDGALSASLFNKNFHRSQFLKWISTTYWYGDTVPVGVTGDTPSRRPPTTASIALYVELKSLLPSFEQYVNSTSVNITRPSTTPTLGTCLPVRHTNFTSEN
jgi:hypothetical protein